MVKETPNREESMGEVFQNVLFVVHHIFPYLVFFPLKQKIRLCPYF